MAETCFAGSGIAGYWRRLVSPRSEGVASSVRGITARGSRPLNWQSHIKISRDSGPMLGFAEQSFQWRLRLSRLRPIRWRASIWAAFEVLICSSAPAVPYPAFQPLLLGSASGSKPCALRGGGTLLCRFPLKVSPNNASLALGSRTRSLSAAPTEGARKGDKRCSAKIASRSSAFSAKTQRLASRPTGQLTPGFLSQPT